MRKMVMIGLMVLLLQGCGTKVMLETVNDEYVPVALPAAAKISVHLPDQQAQMVIQNEAQEVIYLYQDFSVAIQTFTSGDVEATLKTVTGYDLDELTVMQTLTDGCDRYQCVWTSAGEEGEQVGRVCLLDDGVYHYVISAMAHAQTAGSMTDIWQDMMDSFDIY